MTNLAAEHPDIHHQTASKDDSSTHDEPVLRIRAAHHSMVDLPLEQPPSTPGMIPIYASDACNSDPASYAKSFPLHGYPRQHQHSSARNRNEDRKRHLDDNRQHNFIHHHIGDHNLAGKISTTICRGNDQVLTVPKQETAASTAIITRAGEGRNSGCTSHSRHLPPRPDPCPYFIIQAEDGAAHQQFVKSQGSENKLTFVEKPKFATVFHLNSSGALIAEGLVANTVNMSLYYVYLNTDVADNNHVLLTCHRGDSLECNAAQSGQSAFAVCPDAGPGDPGNGPRLLFGTQTTSDCSVVTLRTRSAPQCRK
jgi:hypothetical protein